MVTLGRERDPRAVRERKSERRVHLFWGGVERDFFERGKLLQREESCYRGRDSSFWVRARTSENVIFLVIEEDFFLRGDPRAVG